MAINPQNSTLEMNKVFNCQRCKQHIGRVAISCRKCLKDFHPKCIEVPHAHKIYDDDNQLVPCDGITERFQIQSSGSKRKRVENTEDGVDDDEIINERVESSQDTTKSFTTPWHMLEAKFYSVEANIDKMNEQNIQTLKSEIKEQIRQECENLRGTFAEILAKQLSTITAQIYREINGIKNKIPAFSPDGQSTVTESNSTNKHRSYSSVTQKNIPKNKTTNEINKANRERIILKPRNEQQKCEETLDMLTSKIDVAHLGIGVNKLINTSSGKIIIDVEKETDQIKLAEEIQNKLSDVVTVTPLTKKLPKLKIVNLDEKILNMEEKSFITNIYKQSGIQTDQVGSQEIKIIKKYSTKLNKGSVIIQVHPIIHKNLLKSAKVQIGWKNYKVYNFVDIVRCFKCWGYNHFQDKCTKDEVCRKCGGKHEDTVCVSEIKQCVNCMYIVKKHNLSDWDVNHEATSHNCKFYAHMIKKRKENIVYKTY